MLELEITLLGYRFEVQTTREKTIELWCYKSGKCKKSSSTMCTLNAWQLHQFLSFKYNPDLFQHLSEELQNILLELIIENRYGKMK
jgi:hypothetical protein